MKMQNRSFRLVATVFLVTLILLPNSVNAKTKSKWVSLRPLGSPSYAELQGKDKTYRYYPVASGQTVEIEVAGPRKLRIATRLGFSPDTGLGPRVLIFSVKFRMVAANLSPSDAAIHSSLNRSSSIPDLISTFFNIFTRLSVW